MGNSRGRTYQSKYQGQGGIFSAGSRRGQTHYGTSGKSNTKFFEFKVVDNIKRAGKNIKKLFD